jgi:hypothetical protein
MVVAPGEGFCLSLFDCAPGEDNGLQKGGIFLLSDFAGAHAGGAWRFSALKCREFPAPLGAGLGFLRELVS